MSIQLPNEWAKHLDSLKSSPGTVVVVGAIDVGKTTFCALLANQGIEAGIPTAVVDADMGQSEIGPPTTIGMGLVESPIHATGEVKPKSLYFVGSTTPVGNLLASVVGTKKLTEKAHEIGRNLVIVDTTGLVRGAIARRLKTHKIELLRPRHIVALQRTGEAEHFLRLFDTWEDCTVHRLSPAPSARPKSPAIREQRRTVRFHEYFLDGRERQVSFEQLATTGTWLHTGNPLEPKYLKFAEKALGTAVYHGEIIDHGVYLVTQGEAGKQGIGELQEEFRTRTVVTVPAGRYMNLVAALLDSHLEMLSLAIIRAIDFRAGMISLITPLRSLSPARSIAFGTLKLRPDGIQVGRLRPGDV